MTKFIRTMKSINFRKSVTECRFVLFPTSSPNDVTLQQLDVAKCALAALKIDWDMGYFHNPSCAAKGLFNY